MLRKVYQMAMNDRELCGMVWSATSMARMLIPQLDGYVLNECYYIKEPFERAASVKCVDGEPVITDKNDSFGNFHTLPGIAPIDDPWGSWSYAGQDSNSGTPHSHPWFDNADEFMEGLGCSGSVPGHIVVYPDQNLLNQQNSAGENISQGDIATFSGGVGPGYVRTSSGTKVKRYLSGVQTELLP